ncbi:MAG: radical SAM protein [Candidatus Peribacteria bacterium]|jgi:hypothetical protein|nr:radical SAM protein [Candidatus Peribacteria bacterium]
MKKLRLLVTPECPNSCPLCCNKQINLDGLPIASSFTYEEIIITGGEPVLYYLKVAALIKTIRETEHYTGNRAKIYLQTAVYPSDLYVDRLYYIMFNSSLDGIALTVHSKEAIPYLQKLQNRILNRRDQGKNLSLKLISFKGRDFSAEDYPNWSIKNNVEWLEDCPLPSGEVFMRLKQTWKEGAVF